MVLERRGPHCLGPPSEPGGDNDGVISRFSTLLGESQKATAALPPGEEKSGLWGALRPLCGGQPSPPRLPWVSSHDDDPVGTERLCAVSNLLCVHLFVLLLPLNGGKQTFWEEISIWSSQNVKHSNGKYKSILNFPRC